VCVNLGLAAMVDPSSAGQKVSSLGALHGRGSRALRLFTDRKSSSPAGGAGGNAKGEAMAHQFPEIVAYGSAFRCALEAEQACADFAAAAGVLAPDQAWRDKLEEVVCTHDDRVAKLTVIRQEVNEMILEPIHALHINEYLGTLDAEPATSWPAVALQLIQAEEDTARYHEDFVAQCDEILAASARAFKKSAKQDRAAAAELKSLL